MHFIGIDLHKRIFTACVLNDDEKVVEELVDIETDEKGLDFLMSRYPADDCRIVFENLTRAHFAFHYLYDHGYAVSVAHTGHGALREIADTNLKTDKVDAYKLALVCKDMWAGRRFIRRTHISSDENMRMKAVIRVANECSCIRDEMKLRIMEYMNLHNIQEHPRYKDVAGMRYREYLLGLGDPALTRMVNMMSAAIEEITAADLRAMGYEEGDSFPVSGYIDRGGNGANGAVVGLRLLTNDYLAVEYVDGEGNFVQFPVASALSVDSPEQNGRDVVRRLQ